LPELPKPKNNMASVELIPNPAGFSAEVNRMSEIASRSDALTVASIAYRMKLAARAFGLDWIEEGASRIEDSARRNQATEYLSEIQLLEHQLRSGNL
jgi:hypothetical protein